MTKQEKTFIFILAMIVVIILSWILIRAISKGDDYDSSLCTICHQNKRIANATYCYSCYLKAQERVEEKKKNEESVGSKTGSGSASTGASGDASKTGSGSSTSTTSGDKKESSTGSSGGSSVKPSSGSSSKEYNYLNYDPEDYDDPDEYADDAWDEDFDDYDEAYEYWEDY